MQSVTGLLVVFGYCSGTPELVTPGPYGWLWNYGNTDTTMTTTTTTGTPTSRLPTRSTPTPTLVRPGPYGWDWNNRLYSRAATTTARVTSRVTSTPSQPSSPATETAGHHGWNWNIPHSEVARGADSAATPETSPLTCIGGGCSDHVTNLFIYQARV